MDASLVGASLDYGMGHQGGGCGPVAYSTPDPVLSNLSPSSSMSTGNEDAASNNSPSHYSMFSLPNNFATNTNGHNNGGGNGAHLAGSVSPTSLTATGEGGAVAAMANVAQADGAGRFPAQMMQVSSNEMNGGR